MAAKTVSDQADGSVPATDDDGAASGVGSRRRATKSAGASARAKTATKTASKAATKTASKTAPKAATKTVSKSASKAATRQQVAGGADAAGVDQRDAPQPGAAPVGAAPLDVIVNLDAQSIEHARHEAVVEAGDAGAVGDFVDARIDGPMDGGATDAGAADRAAGRVVTVRFAAAVPGYRGWQWSVTVAELPGVVATVSEVVLLPGPEALLAPAWVPWKERVRGDDLGVGDLLPIAPDDVRIVPAYVQSDDPAIEEMAREIGLGRVRVLSREGRADAAERWHDGDFGPQSEMARHAPGVCTTCAFYVPVAGALGGNFGVCTNAYSPADGHVVDARYGCGAHSEAVVERAAASATGDVVVDELTLEVFQRADGDQIDAEPEPAL